MGNHPAEKNIWDGHAQGDEQDGERSLDGVVHSYRHLALNAVHVDKRKQRSIHEHTSNHLTGCAADIRVTNMEQLIRYAAILLDYTDETGEEFDELLLERNRFGVFWLHFAVKPKGNRHKVLFISV